MHKFKDKKCILIDDPYPIKLCTAVGSISYGIAKFLNYNIQKSPELIKPIVGSIYCEPTENQHPASSIIYPNHIDEFEDFNNIINKIDDVDIFLSSTLKQISFKNDKPILHLKFDLDLSKMIDELFELPPGAYIKQRIH